MLLFLIGAMASCNTAGPPPSSSNTDIPADRVVAERVVRFNFHYEFEVHDLPRNAERMRVWVPAPRRDFLQYVRLLKIEAPVDSQVATDPQHGNRYLYFDLPLPAAQPLKWIISWQIHRRQIDGPLKDKYSRYEQYLSPNRLVPLHGTVADLAQQVDLSQHQPVRSSQQLYHFLLDRMSYSKHGTGWGRGDAEWACQSKYGNCTDFHSVFIALSRVNKVPAKFEMGFGLPYTGSRGLIGGYHCWAKFFDRATGWWALDISEADKHSELSDYYFGRLTARRVHFTTGRDLNLVPRQAGPPLNYLVYPYVEVDGKIHNDIHKQFSYDSLKILP